MHVRNTSHLVMFLLLLLIDYCCYVVIYRWVGFAGQLRGLIALETSGMSLSILLVKTNGCWFGAEVSIEVVLVVIVVFTLSVWIFSEAASCIRLR